MTHSGRRTGVMIRMGWFCAENDDTQWDVGW